MGKGKRNKRRGRGQTRGLRPGAACDWLEVGEGDYVVVTLPREEGPPVFHRFETEDEALAHHRQNVGEDRPRVGSEGFG